MTFSLMKGLEAIGASVCSGCAYIKKQVTLPLAVVLLALVIGFYHLFSYMIPFTDNAFVVTNVTPVAADVSGFITDIHVNNGQQVKKDQPIFTVYQIPYR
jgi:multidrug resistance efflux pump